MGVTLATWRKVGDDKTDDGLINVADIKALNVVDVELVLKLISTTVSTLSHSLLIPLPKKIKTLSEGSPVPFSKARPSPLGAFIFFGFNFNGKKEEQKMLPGNRRRNNFW